MTADSAPNMRDFQIFVPFEKRVSADGELRLFGGIASSSSVDRDLERMDKSVMGKIASDLKKNSTVFFNHDTKGLGVGTVATAEVRGGEVYIDVVPTKAAGMQDVVTQIQEGILKSFSIGGKILDWENQFDDALGKTVRVIKDVDCYEVSVVGVPSNRDASILSYIQKSFEGDVVEEKKEAAPTAEPTVIAKEAAPPAVLSKGEHDVMFKCAKCGADNVIKVADEKQDPAQGPHEDGKKAMELEFSKAVSEFEAKFVSKMDEMEKGSKAKEEEYSLMLKAANARIDELHKAIETKSKALAAETDDLQKDVKETEVKTSGGSFGVFPRGKAY